MVIVYAVLAYIVSRLHSPVLSEWLPAHNRAPVPHQLRVSAYLCNLPWSMDAITSAVLIVDRR